MNLSLKRIWEILISSFLESDFVMLDLEDSMVTYTEVSSPFEDLSDIGSSRVDGLPMMPEDPYAYVEAALQAPPSPDYVPGLEHPPLLQPLPAAVSPTADSPGYITESDPEEDSEEDPAEYLDDRDDEEEEMSIRDQTPIPFLSAAEVDRFLAISTPPPSPLTSYSSPLPHIPSPPLPVSSPLPVSPPPLPASPTYPLGYRAGTSPLLPIPLPTPSPPLLLPSTIYRAGVSKVTLSPQKRLCITLSLRFKVGKSSSAPTARPVGEFRRDYGFVSTLDDEIRRDLKRDVGYGITDTWDEMVEDMQGTPTATDVPELSQRMTYFVTTIRQDTYEIYGRLDDVHDHRSLMSGQLNMPHKDRRAHARTARLMESEARISCEAWVQSMDASDTACFEMAVLQSQQPPARDPAHPDVPEEAGSSS
ncbi:hypothetical protein Tco_1113670 [Tanacetum coccineum]|uniref:Uncharacterized protein n=1 Tax=Tanacetum coccineum TaxID=301880 RepID=A0ABQ5IV63_9ASTR